CGRSGPSTLAPAFMAEMESRLGVPVLDAYGMTEAAHQMASNPLPPAPRKPGTAGPGTGVEIRILEDGEVAIRGANVIDGYEGNPEANAGSFLEGWVRTGDARRLDAHGYLEVLGRRKALSSPGALRARGRRGPRRLPGRLPGTLRRRRGAGGAGIAPGGDARARPDRPRARRLRVHGAARVHGRPDRRGGVGRGGLRDLEGPF